MIFISHKSIVDDDFILELVDVLKSNDITYWIAPECVGNNEDYAEVITKAIISCEYFLLVLSEEAQNSKHIRKEVGIALDLNKPFIVLKRGDFSLSYRYKYLLEAHQFFDFDFDAPDYTELIEKCKCGEPIVSMELNKVPRRSITIMRGDFHDNIDNIIENSPEILPHTVFAIGIDRSSLLSVSSNQGILKCVYTYLRDKYNISVNELQSLVNEAKKEQLGYAEEHMSFQFKDSVLIKVPICKNSLVGKNTEHVLQLLLIANSQKKSDFYKSHDTDAVEGIDSREIIIEVFNKCSTLGSAAENLFLGAMGTNGLSFPYEVITAEIMNCFAYSGRTNSMPENLYFSVREEDMEKHNITTDEILTYISRIVYFFKN